MTIGHLYLALLGLGLLYAILAGVMGWLSDLGGAHAASGNFEAARAILDELEECAPTTSTCPL